MRSQRRRWLWKILGGGFIGAVVTCTLLLTPPVQGWLVRRWVAMQPGWKVEFEHISLGPTGADARGLSFSTPGIEGSSAPIAVKVALSHLFSRRELRIERLDAKRLRLAITPARMPASPPFDGLLKLLQSPLPWALDTANVTGELDLRGETQSQLKGNFAISGGGLSLKEPGEFSYELSLNSALLPTYGAQTLRSTGKIRLVQDSTHALSRLTLSGDLQLPNLVHGDVIKGDIFIEVVASATGEIYQARLNVGSEMVLQLEASLDATRTELSGHATFNINRSLAAQFSKHELPAIQANGKIEFNVNLATSDLDTAIESNFSMGEWNALFPPLAVVDTLQGHLSTHVQRKAGKLMVSHFKATLHGEQTPFATSLALIVPIDPLAFPESPFARLTLERWPAKWAHPLLGSAELNGTWAIALDRMGTIHMSPEQPLTLGPLAFPSELLASLSPTTLSCSPQLDLSRDRLAMSISDLRLTTPNGDSLDVVLSAVRESATSDVMLRGSMRGVLPTLLAGKSSPFPLVAEASFESQLQGGGPLLHLSAVTGTIQSAGNSKMPPYLSLRLTQPLTLDLAQFTPHAGAVGEENERMQLSVRQLPLNFISRWTPGYEINGTFRTGEFSLSSTSEGGLALHSRTPLEVDDLTVTAEGVNRFHGTTTASLGVAWLGTRLAGKIKEINWTQSSGNHVRGQLGFSVDLATKSGRTIVALDADIPSPPESFKDFAPLQASLRADIQSVTEQFLGASELAIEVNHAAGELLSIKAETPLVFGVSDNGMLVATTASPVPIRVGKIPLTSLRPWLGGLPLTGTLSSSRFELNCQGSQHTLRAISPITAEGVVMPRGEQTPTGRIALSMTPSAEITLLSRLEPKFEMAYSGSIQLSAVRIESEGKQVLEAEASLGFKGNDQLVLGNAVQWTSRLDFASLAPLTKATTWTLPQQGILVTKLGGQLLSAEPIELSTRLSGLPNPDEEGELPPLEFKVRGKISRDDVFTGGAELLLTASRQPSDAAFDIRMNLVDRNLAITSALRSRYFDAGALLKVARAFGGKQTVSRTPSVDSPAKNTNSRASIDKSETPSMPTKPRSESLPYWGALRGSFDLDIGTLRWGHYQIDRVTGHLDATDRSLALHTLGGELFSGRWSGEVQIGHEPEREAGSHGLQANFYIQQFESARVIQSVFPNQIASLDTRLHLRTSVSSYGDTLSELIDRSESNFSLQSESGVMRLAVPKSDRLATAAVFGGTLLLSPELRALGRLLRKFSEMPVDQLTITGHRTAAGEISLDQFRFDSAQLRLLGSGKVLNKDNEPVMNRPLELSLQLAVKDELAVILGGMKLLEKTPAFDGFRNMHQPIALGGLAGDPDTTPLYDLLAKAVSGSRGTWGFLMRKVHAEVKKKNQLVPNE